MDIGTVAILLSEGKPLVSRCEVAPHGIVFVPATNAQELIPEACHILELDGIDLGDTGLYLCPNHLIEAAEFPSIQLPGDLVTYAAARDILYPDVSLNTGLQRIRRDVQAGRLQAYRIGYGTELRQFVSRGQVRVLARGQAELVGI